MPISKFQSGVLRLLAAQRSPDSYIAGDEAVLATAGYTLKRPPNQRTARHQVTIEKAGEPVQPDMKMLDKYQRNPGAPGGAWPTSPDIARAMLERYGI